MTKFFQKVRRTFLGFRPTQDNGRVIPKPSSIFFNSITVLNKTPSNDSVADKQFILVMQRTQPIWAMFRCPCGCGYVISLPLQKIHTPHWVVTRSLGNRPTLYPSVSQSKGCRSHFWIEDGRVYWCTIQRTGLQIPKLVK